MQDVPILPASIPVMLSEAVLIIAAQAIKACSAEIILPPTMGKNKTEKRSY
jgi:hypothetical protein